MRVRLLWAVAAVVLSSLLMGGCSNRPSSPQSILGRWRVAGHRGMSVPNSFFWYTMDYLEFREDGTVLALMRWPPEVGNDIRLNKTAKYALVGDHQIAFTGACRYEDPCTGLYTTTLRGDEMQIFDAEAELTLVRVGQPGKALPATIPGPSPSATPGPAR